MRWGWVVVLVIGARIAMATTSTTTTTTTTTLPECLGPCTVTAPTVDSTTGLWTPAACSCDWDESLLHNIDVDLARACFDNRCDLPGDVLTIAGGSCDPGTQTCVLVKTDSSGHSEWQDLAGLCSAVCP